VPRDLAGICPTKNGVRANPKALRNGSRLAESTRFQRGS